MTPTRTTGSEVPTVDSQVSRLRLLGLLFWLVGGLAITLGWAGTAQVTCVDCQVPYLISGGAGGLALTIAGTGLLVVAQLRVEGHRIAQRLAPPADRESGPATPGEATTEPVQAEPVQAEPVRPLTIADRNAR